jgi:hypothetical protein
VSGTINLMALRQRRFLMSLEQAILEAVRALPVEKQQELLSHAARPSVTEEERRAPSRMSEGYGRSEYFSVLEEIEENQIDMWRNFPRKDL